MQYSELPTDAILTARKCLLCMYMEEVAAEYEDCGEDFFKIIRKAPLNAYDLIEYACIKEYCYKYCYECGEIVKDFWQWLDEGYGYRREGYSSTAICSLFCDFMAEKLTAIEENTEITEEFAQDLAFCYNADFDEDGYMTNM